MTLSFIEEIAMQKSIEVARLSKHEDSGSHPFVGAVLVKDNKIIESACRGEFDPGDHAEYTLLEKKLKDQLLAGSILFTTLEPCTKRNHPKIPCVDRVIERKIKKVWIGMVDPDERIKGEGVRRLVDANIEVAYYPKEYADMLEELNREFKREKRKIQIKETIDPKKLENLYKKSLDDWYIMLNRIYWNRNFYKDVSQIFSHLVEVIGGLSLLASEKKKLNVSPIEYLSKAIAWWLALCGKLGINSVQEMLWDKFPYRCPYCQLGRHDDKLCKAKKSSTHGPDWKFLREIGENQTRPAKIKEWQQMFESIYPTNQTDDYKAIFARLVEELGELSEAIRIFPAEPGYFLSEASDVFAWLMKIQNIFDNKNESEVGELLTKQMAMNYPEVCLDCNQSIFSCPPILKSTIGRIAHEVPMSKSSLLRMQRFLTPIDSSEKFGIF